MDNMKKWLRIQDEDEEQPEQEQDQGPSILEQVSKFFLLFYFILLYFIYNFEEQQVRKLKCLFQIGRN